MQISTPNISPLYVASAIIQCMYLRLLYIHICLIYTIVCLIFRRSSIIEHQAQAVGLGKNNKVVRFRMKSEVSNKKHGIAGKVSNVDEYVLNTYSTKMNIYVGNYEDGSEQLPNLLFLRGLGQLTDDQQKALDNMVKEVLGAKKSTYISCNDVYIY